MRRADDLPQAPPARSADLDSAPVAWADFPRLPGPSTCTCCWESTLRSPACLLVAVADPRVFANARKEGKFVPYSAHNPHYIVDLAAIPVGTKVPPLWSLSCWPSTDGIHGENNRERKSFLRTARSGLAGLTTAVEGLAAAWYFDPAHYRRELEQIWYRHWIYACRAADLAKPRAASAHSPSDDQSILLVRGDDGVARAFHNTCRHRGAALCKESAGRFPPAGIVCPYHAWRYSLKGELLQTSSKVHGEGFEFGDFPLYGLPVTEWNGFLFTALTAAPAPFSASFDLPLERFDDWRLEDLVVGHRLTKTIRCNWKVFWENYNECLHCPGVHPSLAQLVPIFGRALLERRDDPAWQDHAHDDDPRYGGGLRPAPNPGRWTASPPVCRSPG